MNDSIQRLNEANQVETMFLLEYANSIVAESISVKMRLCQIEDRLSELETKVTALHQRLHERTQ